MIKLRFLVSMAAVIAMIMAVGCSKSDSTASPTAKPAASAPVTPPAAAATSVPNSPTAAPSASSGIKDYLGRTVSAPPSPKRIVALSPSVVELLYAVGAPPTARPSTANYPAEAKSLADIGTSYQPSMEKIAEQKPDLVIGDALIQRGMVQQLESLNVPLVMVGLSNFADVTKALRLVGQVAGKQKEGEAAAAALEKKLSDLQQKIPAQKPKVLIVIGAPDAFYAGKSGSYAGDLVRLLGGINVVEGQPDVGRYPGYTQLSMEQIVKENPDVILIASPGGPGAPKGSQVLAKDPVWGSLAAVKNNRVQEIDPDPFVQSAGPRVGQALDDLFAMLYPKAS